MQKQIVRNESMRTVIRYAFWLLSLFLMSEIQAVTPQKAPLKLGAERMDVVTRLLKDKQVGLVVNQTSILEKQQKHLLDALLEEGINIKKVFAPEHGFRGTVFYTYISTMHYVMEACAENDVEFIVLDRPNPNDFVDGPVRQKGFESFVGVDPLPILHGLTVGELAWMINKEGWLKSTPDTCKLHIVKMENWRHGDPYWLPVKPSPNLPNDQSIRLYPSLCFFEGTNISVGRGTYYPFQILGAPDARYGDFTFTPTSLPGFDTKPLHKDKECYGTDLREYPFTGGLTLKFLLDFYNKAGNDQAFFFTRPQWFDLLAGTKELRFQIVRGLKENEIRASWQPALNKDKKIRKKYLLYPDYR